MRHATAVLVFLLAAASVSAQDLTITARYVQASVSTTTTTSTTATIEGQPLVFDSSSTGTAPTPATAALIDVNTAASMVRLKCRTATVKKLESGNVWAIVMPGEHLIEATAVDFDLKIWDEAELRITIEGELPDPIDPVDPDPVDPIDPDPPIVVVDAYMVGQAAYDASRQYTPEQRATIADVYRRSAEFLYGRPVLKYIAGPDDPNLTNPDLSVFAWQTQQLIGQREFLESMREPLITAQQTLNCDGEVCRGFAREDWYGAFNEIAEAVTK